MNLKSKERNKTGMKKKLLAALLCFTMVIAAGCGGNSAKETEEEAKMEEKSAESEESESEGEEYVTWIREAWDEYKSSDIRGTSDSRFEGRYKDVSTIDTAKQQWMTVYYDADFGEEPRDTDLRVKEGDTDYIYKKVRTGETEYMNLKVQAPGDADEEETYSGYISREVLPFESDDETEVLSVSAEEEGEEEINGVKAIKFAVSYETLKKNGEKITREDILNEKGWTEEELELLSEFRISELIDACVEKENELVEQETTEPGYGSTTYYLSSDGHKLLRRIHYVSGGGRPTDILNEPGQVIRQLKTCLEDGLSKEEAVQWVTDYLGYDWDFDGIMEAMTTIGSSATEVTTDYLTGEECEPMCEIPADAKELTWDAYMTGAY